MDKRVIKTKRLICNVYTELLSEKDFDEIKVTEIAERAEINRKTIYNYYKSTDDILNEIEDSLVKNYEEVINNLAPSISLRDPYILFDKLTEVLNNNLEFYRKLMKMNTNSRLAQKFVNVIISKVKSAFLEQDLFEESDVDFVTNYVVSGMIAAYQRWFNSGMQVPIEQFSKNISNLVYNGINHFIKAY